MTRPQHLPGSLPPGLTLDSLLTPEQFAVWRQIPVPTVRRRLIVTPGVIRESRKDVRIHPRSYLDGMLKRKKV